MADERVAARKPAAALVAEVRALARVQLEVALEVVDASKLGRAGLAGELFFLRVNKQVRFQIVLSGKSLWAVDARVLFDVAGTIGGGHGAGHGASGGAGHSTRCRGLYRRGGGRSVCNAGDCRHGEVELRGEIFQRRRLGVW